MSSKASGFVALLSVVLLTLAACGGSSTKPTTSTPVGYSIDSPQAFAYDACQQHAFGGEGLLLPSVKPSTKWPALNSEPVTVTGSGTRYSVLASVSGMTPAGVRTTWPIDCTATRRPGNRWDAAVTVGNGVPQP